LPLLIVNLSLGRSAQEVSCVEGILLLKSSVVWILIGTFISFAGRRHGGDQLVAKQYETRLEQVQKDMKDRLEQNEKEAAARQEQVQKEAENLIREKDTRIQVRAIVSL